MKGLTNQQRKFCEEYVNNGNNGTQAYLKSYKSCKKEETAMVNASRLLRNAKVNNYVTELRQKLQDKAIMTAEERMNWLTKVINGEIKEKTAVLKTNYETGEEEMIEKDFPSKLDTKLKSLDILNKMTGQYVTNLNGNVNLSFEEVLKKVSEKDEY